VAVQAEVLRLLADWSEAPPDAPPPSDRRFLGEARSVVGRYLTHLVGRPLRMHRFLKLEI
jgi:hypothetical protein